ncbi:ATP-dependent DNA helicase [Akkermansiaceae bacterium]|nr:ATP-dependent DNA helicase [Akkermansiaceae bacterium]MDB4288276.1 ATP-dependent DNA helicase [bacterium]MDB4289182.1 ATP-dependent DNA helicase [bacterium]MDB4299305.1 ATP-dependent DNA helicase [bacterium]MDB4299895.1 ATP-dependent DNA helicase [bacterium]
MLLMATVEKAREVLKEVFGFEDFLDGQESVMEEILSGKDGSVVMPTGGGKSLCYQLPALCREGVTLVVSPLIALMKDQVDALERKNVAVTFINSTLSWDEQRERLDAMKRGDFSLVYIAPERFKASSFMNAMKEVKISMVAVDEAHCLSQWGHDFRPDYMRLGAALEALGRPQCIALTATATPVVREDIRTVLRLRDPFERISGFERPNLSFTITPVEKVAQKYVRMKKVIEAHKTGIVYCATRKKVEEVAETIHSWGHKCVAYHGGLKDSERERTQNSFINREADIAVATNAFGMGIDRADVRFVIHFEIPGSVEAYYQEAGRAGRDGEAAVCDLLFNYADTRTQDFFIEGVNPGAQLIRELYEFLLNDADENYEVIRTLDEIKEATGAKNAMALGNGLGHLMRSRMVERFDVPGSRAKGTRLLKPEVLTRDIEINEKALEEKERRDREKLEKMVQLCYANTCRQQWILEYFGEVDAPVCGSCDVCQGSENSERRGPTDSEALIVLKFLSGVARMSRRTATGWEGCFGRGRVIQMLVGSKSQDILRTRLHELKTYGILKDEGTAYLNSLCRLLHEGGLLVTQMGEYPLVTLTARGEQVMKNLTSYSIEWPGQTGAPAGVDMEDLGFDARVYEKLRDVRTQLAKTERVPAYVIFSNETLEHLSRLRPTTMEAGLLVKGIGQAKADKYLEPFLRVLRDL